VKRSTPVTWAELRVGVLVVVALFIGLVAVFTLGERVGLFSPKYTLYTIMPSVSGLQAGAPVRLAGVGVGSIEEVRFMEPGERDSLNGRMLRAYGDSLGDRSVIVSFTVERDVQDKVTRASRAKIGTVGLLGDKYLDLEVGDPREPILEDGDIVLNERPIDYEGLIARAAEGVEELVSSLEGSREIIASVNEGQGTLGRLINDPELYNEWLRLSRQGTDVLNQVQHGEGALPSLLNDRRLYDQLVTTTSDLEKLTTDIREGDGSLGRLIRDPELYNELVRTVREGQALVQEMQEGEGTLARLVNDPALYERMNRFVVEAQGLMTDIQTNPRKYINLQIF
jgi:phospholipid/cholesterol/gamma-HCH transport system substrate-binding protein